MTPREHLEIVRGVAERDGRYACEALLFVSESVGETVKMLKSGALKPNDPSGARDERGGMFHVSGQELLDGMRLLALQRWGLLARHVLAAWGVRSTRDIGNIVFLMVESPEMEWKKRDCDRIEDFQDYYDFATAFDVWT